VNIFLITCKEKEDVWNKISSAEDIIGEWERIPASSVVEDVESPIAASVITYIFSKDNENNLIFEIRNNFEPFLDSVINNPDKIRFDYTKDSFWEGYVEAHQGYSQIYEKYYERTIYILPYDENKKFGYDHRDLNYFNDFYINKLRNKIKHTIIDNGIFYGEDIFKKK
jgi:hypothetical protein